MEPIMAGIEGEERSRRAGNCRCCGFLRFLENDRSEVGSGGKTLASRYGLICGDRELEERVVKG